MQNEDTSFPARKKHPVKSCCLPGAAAVLGCFLLVLAGIACFVIADSAELHNEDLTLTQRLKRYKVACQFIWVDFKTWVSRKLSNEPPDENDPAF